MSAKAFDSILSSPLGAAVKSPLNVRETTEGGEFGYILGDGDFGLRYDSASDSWSAISGAGTASGLPGVFAVAKTGERLLGYRHGGAFSGSARLTRRYDPTSDTWLSTSDTQSRHVEPASSAVSDQGFTYGGRTINFTVDPADRTVETYMPDSDTWVSQATSLSRMNHRAVGIGRRHYVTGGSTEFLILPGAAALTSHRSYAVDTQSWAVLPSMQQRRSIHLALAPASASADDVVHFAIQGNTAFLTNPNRRVTTDHVERFDGTESVWTTVTTHPASRYAASGFSLDDGIYTCGGLTELRSANDEVFRFNNNTWVARAAMPDPRGTFASGVKL